MKVEVRCPACSKKGEVEIEKEQIKNSSRGLLAINISNAFCEHQFVAYIDENLKVRDCFLTDFEVEIPELKFDKEEESQIPLLEKIDTILIKINLPISLIASIIRGIIYKKKIKLLLDQTFLFNQIESFIFYITKDSFVYDFKPITKNDYLKNKKNFKRALIFEDNNILKDNDGIFKKRSLKVERTIVRRFYNEIDPKSSLIILKNELKKSFELSKAVINFINENNEKEIQSKMIIDYLKERKGITIDIIYLEFLIDIIENYFEIKFQKASEISSFLGSL